MPARLGRLLAINVPATSAGASTPALSARYKLVGWSLISLRATSAGTEASVAVAAAAAGTLTLTGFALVSSVVVSPAAAWPAGVNAVAVTFVTGGTQTAEIPGGTTNPVVITFNPPVGVTGTPSVSVPAIVGGPAYTIAASGATLAGVGPQLTSDGTLFDGAQILGEPAAKAGESDTRIISTDGIETDSGVVLTVNNGTLQGCLYVRERFPVDYPGDWQDSG